jgi:hypothetical protein
MLAKIKASEMELKYLGVSPEVRDTGIRQWAGAMSAK